MIFTKDADGNFVGPPRYSDELSPMQKHAVNFGLQDVRSSNSYPGVGSSQFSVKGVHPENRGTFKSSSAFFNTHGRMATGTSDFTAASFSSSIDARMPAIDTDETVYEVEVYFSNAELLRSLGDAAQSHYKSLYPRAFVNLRVDAPELDRASVATTGRHLRSDSDGNPNAIGVRLNTVEKNK